MKKELILTLLAIIAFSSFASAEIVFSQTNSIYNSGDEFTVLITLHSQNHASGFLLANLICDSEEIEIYRAPYLLAPNSPRQVQISANFGNFLVSKGGDCYIKAIFNNEQKNSQKFEITREIEVSFDLDKTIALPGESVLVTGSAAKINGNALSGFVEINVEGTNFSHSSQISNGAFNFTFIFPANIRSGTYEVNVRAYEKDSEGEIINEGKESSTIRIKQVPKKIEIALSAETVSPKTEMKYSPKIIDQAGDNIDRDISLIVYAPNQREIKREIIRSENSNSLLLDSNASPGEWKIESKFENIMAERKFIVEELKELSYTVENEVLTVRNTGNIPFTGPIQITIDDVTEVKDIENLNLGESKKYRLIGPQGEHTISAGSEGSLTNLGTAFFPEGTGKAVAIRDFSSSGYGLMLTLLWILVIVFAAVIAFYFYKKVRRKSYIGTAPSTSTTKFKTLPRVQTTSQQTDRNFSMIDKGEKQEAAVVSLKLNNVNSIHGTPASDTVDSLLYKAKDAGAKVYSDGEYRIAVFAPALTKQRDNSIKAINFAQEAERIIHSHNKRSGVKIDFGIGVSTGDLIIENQDGKFKFMSVSNVIGSTKRISHEAKSESLMSEALRRKLVGKVKSSKLHDKNLYRIEKVTDRSPHEDFINKFKQRNK